MDTMDGTEKAPFREPGKTFPKGRLRQMKQEDGKGIGDPVYKYYFFSSEARDFSRGYFTTYNSSLLETARHNLIVAAFRIEKGHAQIDKPVVAQTMHFDNNFLLIVIL